MFEEAKPAKKFHKEWRKSKGTKRGAPGIFWLVHLTCTLLASLPDASDPETSDRPHLQRLRLSFPIAVIPPTLMPRLACILLTPLWILANLYCSTYSHSQTGIRASFDIIYNRNDWYTSSGMSEKPDCRLLFSTGFGWLFLVSYCVRVALSARSRYKRLARFRCSPFQFLPETLQLKH
jgi:hypothetical protein